MIASILRYILLLPALLLMLAFGACGEKDGPTMNQARIAADAPDEESRNATILLTDSSWTKARIQVGRIRKYYGRAETLLDSGVYVEFYARDGGINATLVADSARVDDRTSDMVAFGDVHVESQGGSRIVDTDRMNYDHEGERVHSTARVKIVDNVKGQNLRGVGFESDLSLTHYKIYRISGQVESPQ